jgi:DNA-binding CsgD family transcriptional regulator
MSGGDVGPAGIGVDAGLVLSQPHSEVPRASTVLAEGHWLSIAHLLQLSPRELQVSQCVVDGDNDAEIARRLGISRHTVHAHLERVYRKLGVGSRCGLVVQLFAAYVVSVSDLIGK